MDILIAGYDHNGNDMDRMVKGALLLCPHASRASPGRWAG